MLVSGHVAVMGCKTYEKEHLKALLNYGDDVKTPHVIEGALNLVVSNTLTMNPYRDEKNTWIEVRPLLDDAFESFRRRNVNETVYVLGGTNMFKQVFDNYAVDDIYETVVDIDEKTFPHECLTATMFDFQDVHTKRKYIKISGFDTNQTVEGEVPYTLNHWQLDYNK
jgi:dihydrofolate reductase